MYQLLYLHLATHYQINGTSNWNKLSHSLHYEGMVITFSIDIKTKQNALIHLSSAYGFAPLLPVSAYGLTNHPDHYMLEL